MATKPPSSAAAGASAVKPVVLPYSFARNGFPVIRQASIRLGFSVVVAVLLIAGSRYFLSRQEASRLQAQSELSQAQQQYTEITDKKNDINHFQPRYVELAQRGFVGDEKRLDAIETIHNIQDSRKLLPITYEIFPQQVVQIDPSLLTGDLELRASKVAVHMSLLHEIDLLNFLNDLGGKAAFIPQNCSMKSKDAGDVPGGSAAALPAQLDGECTLYWVTMGRRAATDGAPPAQ